MHGALGDALTVLVRKLLKQLIVLQQNGPARAGRDGVLVVRDRIAGRGGKGGAFAHDTAPGLLPGAPESLQPTPVPGDELSEFAAIRLALRPNSLGK